MGNAPEIENSTIEERRKYITERFPCIAECNMCGLCTVFHEYYRSFEDPETVLLIDSWKDQEAIDAHHASSMMKTITSLREKYDLHMTVERYVSADTPESEERFIRR